MEIWRDIADFEGLYQVSNLGRVKSKNYRHTTGQERVLKPVKDRYGYLRVDLCKDGKVKNMKVHRLVAQAFIPNPNNWPQVNHRDEIKSNNSVENLEWVTASYNTNYGTRIERVIATHNTRKTCKAEQPIIASRSDKERWFKSQHEAARQLGLDYGHIKDCIAGRRHHTGGWSFRRAEERLSDEPLF